MHALSYTTELLKIDGIDLIGISDVDEYRGTAMSSRFNTKYYSDYHDLLAQKPDGVIICSNNSMHCCLSCDALDAGAHVLVEKPFAVSHEEAAQMLEHAKRNNRRIMNAFPMRFNPAVIEAKKTVDSGHIGDILCITGINHGKIPSGWFIDKKLSGGGGVMDHTVHLADSVIITSSKLCSFLGRDHPRSIKYASCGKRISGIKHFLCFHIDQQPDPFLPGFKISRKPDVIVNPCQDDLIGKDPFHLVVVLVLSFRQRKISGQFIFHRLLPFFIITKLSLGYNQLIVTSENEALELPDSLTAFRCGELPAVLDKINLPYFFRLYK